MNNAKFLWMASVLIFFSLSALMAETSQKLNFYYEFRPDANYETNVEMENEITMEWAGNLSAKEAPKFSQNMKQMIGIDMIQNFKEPDKEGHLPFEAKIVDYRMKVFSGGKEIHMPPESLKMIKEAMMQMKWKGKMTKRGKIIDFAIEGMERIPGLSEEDMKKLFSYYPEFPERELDIGDDFTYSVKQPFEFGRGEQALKGEMTINYLYHLKEIREGAAHFDVQTDFQMEGTGSEKENMELKGTGQGYGVYDVERHFFMSMNQDGHFSIFLDVPSKGGQEGPSKEPITARKVMMKMKMSHKMSTTISE